MMDMPGMPGMAGMAGVRRRRVDEKTLILFQCA